jgi:ribosomal 50S subunit-recycling heat shock protein
MQRERRFDSSGKRRQQQQQQQAAGAIRTSGREQQLGRRVEIDDDVAIRSCVTLIDQSVSQLRRRPRHNEKKKKIK